MVREWRPLSLHPDAGGRRQRADALAHRHLLKSRRLHMAAEEETGARCRPWTTTVGDEAGERAEQCENDYPGQLDARTTTFHAVAPTTPLPRFTFTAAPHSGHRSGLARMS